MSGGSGGSAPHPLIGASAGETVRGEVQDLVHGRPVLHGQVCVLDHPPAQKPHRVEHFHRASWRGIVSARGRPTPPRGPQGADCETPHNRYQNRSRGGSEGGGNRAIGGTGHGGLLPSTDDVVYVTGGLHSRSGPAGLEGVPRSADAVLANPCGLMFLDSGALLQCVYRFSGRTFLQGTLGVAVKANEHQSRSFHVDPVTGAFTPGRASQEGWCQWE